MRAAGLSKFKKLWGRILVPLASGNYQVLVNNSKIRFNKMKLPKICQFARL